MRQTFTEQLPTTGLQWEPQQVWQAAAAQAGDKARSTVFLSLGSGLLSTWAGLIQHGLRGSRSLGDFCGEEGSAWPL